MLEVKHYECSEEIKHLLISIEEYRCRERVPENYLYENPENLELILKHVKDSIKNKLCSALRDFIQVEEISPIEVEATLYLPYVRDDVVKKLEGDIESKRAELRYIRDVNHKLRTRTLWQRIWNKDL